MNRYNTVYVVIDVIQHIVEFHRFIYFAYSLLVKVKTSHQFLCGFKSQQTNPQSTYFDSMQTSQATTMYYFEGQNYCAGTLNDTRGVQQPAGLR